MLPFERPVELVVPFVVLVALALLLWNMEIKCSTIGMFGSTKFVTHH